jgi:hypothetical protein
MSNDPKETFVRELLNQEQTLSPQQYSEYRRKLNERLLRVEREEKSMRIIAAVSWGLWGLLLLAGAIVDLNREHFTETVRLTLIVALVIATNCAVVLSLLYLVRYRPRLRRSEQVALLEQMQHELRELRDRLPPSSP